LAVSTYSGTSGIPPQTFTHCYLSPFPNSMGFPLVFWYLKWLVRYNNSCPS